MAKKNDSIHPILILLGFIALIITKLVEFITENIFPILTILGLGLGAFLVYNILIKGNKQNFKRQPNKKSPKLTNVTLVSNNVAENPKTDYLGESISITNSELSDEELSATKIKTPNSNIIEEEIAVKEYPHDFMQEPANKRQAESKSFMGKASDEEIKKIAVKEYPDDFFMQEHTYKRQAESKSFMGKTSDEELKRFAVKEYPEDFFMQEHTYKRQAESKSFMGKTSDAEIKRFAVKEYPEDYFMQEHTYKRQAESKSFMGKTTDVIIKKYAEKIYPDDYFMQEHTYNEQIALAPYKRQTIKNQLDETIIDINSEELDLTVEHSIRNTEIALEPPYWSHTYVYSYDEINHTTQAQKKYYFYFKNRVLNGEFVDIQGYTNYAFILYFDLLNEYEKHMDIKLLDEQFKLLGQICPKTKSYSYISLRDLLAKRTDQYSIDKLNNLLEPSYQFENGYSDYDPDTYKLGKQYKDKLGLNKQEVALLNKFWNPSNVFISIEGCCIAVIKQYLFIIKNLNKILKSQNTSIAKEVDFFKEKVFETKEIVNTDWGYSDKSYIKQRTESEVYLTIFKRVENSVREAYGHKRKIGSMPYYDFKGEFETRIGNYVDELILEFQSELELPDTKTLIELNAQNVNRWKLDYKKLTDSFLKDEMNYFIDGIINLEVTNQKNPSIENIFYESSKFIAKYDKVQALKYYAKYIYYDLKSKKFDNQQLTTTIQKSLFTTNEQLVDFQTIIGKLIKNSNIEEALDEISNIYIPKRKKIILDKTQIKEVEMKHTNTVELLNEILVNESVEFEVSPINNENKDEELEVSFGIKTKNNLFFKSEIDLNKVQEQLVQKIATNSFWIHQNEVEKFALDNGLFKNQLIDSINEICAEFLEGEALIEEAEDNYIIEESYYLEIVN